MPAPLFADSFPLLFVRQNTVPLNFGNRNDGKPVAAFYQGHVLQFGVALQCFQGDNTFKFAFELDVHHIPAGGVGGAFGVVIPAAGIEGR